MAFGHATIPVDTHVFRVSNRTGLAPGKTPEEVEFALEKRIPPEYKLHAHHWLILHGRYVCKARRPECWRCLINDHVQVQCEGAHGAFSIPFTSKRSKPSQRPA